MDLILNTSNFYIHKTLNPFFVTFEASKLDKFKYFNSEQNENIEFILVTLLVSKLFNPIISFNFLHSKNICSILVTFEVSKLDKFKYYNS